MPTETTVARKPARATIERRLADFERMVELYQAGAVVEYHKWEAGKKPKRFEVGFRYDCMSDDDYFEVRDLERKYKIKGNPNIRGDAAQSTRGRAALKALKVGEVLVQKSS